MDFMHPSDDYNRPILYTPYLGMPYGGADFDDFPELHGYNRLLVLDGYFKDLQPSRISAFIQAWLYIGLLVEVLNEALGLHEQEGAQLKTENFIRAEDGEEVLDTTDLASYLTSWYERVKSLGSNEIERSRDRVAHLIRTARNFASKALTLEASQAEDFPFQPVIQSSIVVLGSLLDQYASRVYITKSGNWPQSLVALQRLSGSCPNDLAWLISQIDLLYHGQRIGETIPDAIDTCVLLIRSIPKNIPPFTQPVSAIVPGCRSTKTSWLPFFKVVVCHYLYHRRWKETPLDGKSCLL